MPEIKRINLIAAAKELNELLDADPKIKTVAVKSDDLIPAIKAAGELLADGDKITTGTKEVLEGIGVKLPEGIIIDDAGGYADNLSSDETADPIELTDEMLVTLIDEMNVAMSLDPAIKVTDEMTTEGLKTIIKENCYDGDDCQVYDTDKFSADAWKTLKALGVEPVSATPAPPAKDAKAGKKADKKGATPPAKDAKAGKKTAVAKPEKKEKAPKGPGVIKSIASIIKEKGPITKEGILAELVKIFPDRDADAMKNTINVQIPNRINKEQDFQIENTDKGWKVKK